MAWYKQSMATVWGQMASGVMFRHNGRVLLQARSENVEDGGAWGVPGGALKGTEGIYESEELPEPELNDRTIKELWNSAMTEVQEELGFVPKLEQSQIQSSLKNRVENRIDNFVYVTFIVDISDEQASQIQSALAEGSDENWENEGHEWFEQDFVPSNIHPGVEYVLNKIKDKTDITKASLETPMIKIAEDRWTQGQVFIEDGRQYDIEKLKSIVKNNRVTEINLNKLIEQLYDKDVWKYEDRALSPMMVLNNPTFDHVTIRHMSVIRTCNLDDPILVRQRDKKVVDGYHRLTKAVLIGRDKIKVVVVQEEQMNQAEIDLSEDDDYVPPYNLKYLKKHEPHLLKDPVHFWRATTGS